MRPLITCVELLRRSASVINLVLDLALLAVLVSLDYDLDVLWTLGVVRLLVAFNHFVVAGMILFFHLLVRCRQVHHFSVVLRIFLIYFFFINYVLPFWPLAFWWLLSLLFFVCLGRSGSLLAFLS